MVGSAAAAPRDVLLNSFVFESEVAPADFGRPLESELKSCAFNSDSDLNEADDLLRTTSSETGAASEMGSRVCSAAASCVLGSLLNAHVYRFILPSTDWGVRGGCAAFPGVWRDLRRTVFLRSMTIGPVSFRTNPWYSALRAAGRTGPAVDLGLVHLKITQHRKENSGVTTRRYRREKMSPTSGYLNSATAHKYPPPHVPEGGPTDIYEA